MKGFVASWFFPPSTSAEGIVTFKLLKNSSHQYDVCSSASKQWSYQESSPLISPNIHSIFVDTDNIDIWVKKTVRIFEQRHQKHPYDFIMTRSMPPESVKVGLYIKRKYPNIKWIASFADPIGKNPYELSAYISNNSKILNPLKSRTLAHPDTFLPLISGIPDSNIKLMHRLIKLEKSAFQNADLYIFPSYDQCIYSLGQYFNKYKSKCLILPHSYDVDLYPKILHGEKSKLTFTYIGYADNIRSPKPFIKALKLIKDFNPTLLEKLEVKIIGNIPKDIEDMIYAYYLYDTVSVSSSVSYEDSLKIMQSSDWLIHVDAFFSFVPNGTIFFASKIADYIGANKPIFALTSNGSTASKIIKKVGGVSVEPWEVLKMATMIVNIINSPNCTLNQQVRQKYSSKTVSSQFDFALQSWNGNIHNISQENIL